MASISEPFIRRPVGTTLLAIGLFLVGGVAYQFLPVAAVPNVDFPMIRVSATRPGADPSVMAATVAAPLERKLGVIAGLDQITSTSSLGTTSIQLQFAIGRNIDRAARDVQAAINVTLAIINANPLGPVGIFNGDRQSETLSVNRQMRTAAEFRDILIKSSSGNFVRLSDVAEVEDSVRNSRSIAWFNKQPAVLIQIT